ncbi:LytR/AlgR family response regulator transcription factor [Paucibacter sp. JuS9]|uniref:LytR/AlgR family response regulator transcription factor n=1 Tax=Roseateles TaxID=93681 RepID=UPI002FE6A531|eukprot:gene2505-3260_t
MSNTKITTLIAEDEPLAAESLAEWIKELPQLELLGIAPNGPAALEAIRAKQPGLVFMDINMPGMTGLQVLRALAESEAAGLGQVPAVIFTTAYDEHALAAFELHAADYLLKPFSQERFNEAVEHALQRLQSSSALSEALSQASHASEMPVEPLQRILVRDQGKIFPINVEAIEYLRSDTKYTAVASRGKQYLVRLPITAFEQRLDTQRFLKLQRSCIVNLDFVESMTPDDNSQLVVQMQDGSRFTASREVSKKLREQSI